MILALHSVRRWCWLPWLSRGCRRTRLTGGFVPGAVGASAEMGCSLCPKELPACQPAELGLMMNDFLNK